MIEIKASQVIIPENRYRKHFDEKLLEELKQSILRNGLFHPIIVEASDANAAEFILRAGERRLRAMQKLVADGHRIRYGERELPSGIIPALLFSELSAVRRLEIEVEENVQRTDFTWQEKTRAVNALHELRSMQNPGQTITDTASEILGKPAEGSQRTAVSEALTLAKHLDDPDVAKAKSAKEAFKIVQKKAEQAHQAKLAVQFDQTKTPHTLKLGDVRELLPLLPSGSFDVILTDPPYGVDADNFGSQASTGHEYEDSPKYLEELLAVFCDESFRVAKERAHAYVFCDPRRFDRISTLMVLAGWEVFPTPLIWSKGNGMLPLPDHGPRRTYECILYAYKGDRKTLLVKPDVINVSNVKALKHGAQKPVALYKDLLSRSARPGDTVLDCFGGTGPILVAANQLRLVATYIEKSEASYNVALSRVNQRENDDGAVEQDGLEDVAV